MSNQFKVGDQVVRTYDPYGMTPVGTKAVVTEVTAFSVGVMFDGSGPNASWFKENCEVVNQSEVPKCKFVPGNTYKDEQGREYKFLIHVPEASNPYERAVFINKRGAVVLRHEDGHHFDHSSARSRLDILPNKEMRTIYVYTDGVRYLAGPIDSFDEAGPEWKKLGEVKEEVEVY